MAATTTFRRQHRELQRLAAELSRAALTPGYDADRIVVLLRRFLGTLRVHAAMENEALYPALLAHADPDVRARARALHDELGPLYGMMDELAARWDGAEVIDARRIRFRIELARVLARLGWRMMREDRELYPMADADDAPLGTLSRSSA
ncbi:MAG: hemerythrin domain-containing protein [Sandaracinaceae bacterium]|nr:hemerythrin domain-containing protein [Sandaracinaceae bacterium]